MNDKYIPRRKLTVPKDFSFPYEPYSTQTELMRSLFTVLEKKKIGIYESPTGTGKTLSLLCASLTWLEGHEKLLRSDLDDNIRSVEVNIKNTRLKTSVKTNWLATESIVRSQKSMLNDLYELRALMQAKEKLLRELKQRYTELEHMPPKTVLRFIENNTAATMPAIGNDFESPGKLQQNEQMYRGVQIFYCSRTHSQLAQVVKELQKTRFANFIRCVSLASRQQMCIHEGVQRLPSLSLMNETCRDLAKNKLLSTTNKKIPANSYCQYKSQDALQNLVIVELNRLTDIEDIVHLGNQYKACPYYAAGMAQAQAQLILLPYQMLLHETTRKQKGIDIRDAVIIIDEAHNLLDTITQLYSCELSLEQLSLVKEQVYFYKLTYGCKLSSAHLLQINQLLFVIKQLIKVLSAQVAAPKALIMKPHEIGYDLDFFNVNLLDIINFCQTTNFGDKLRSTALRKLRKSEIKENEPVSGTIGLLQQIAWRQLAQNRNGNEEQTMKTSTSKKTVHLAMMKPSPLYPLLIFLKALTTKAEDGRILITPHQNPNEITFKYLLLNPGSRFNDIVQQAHAIIIAGGTLNPIDDIKCQLFYNCPERLVSKNIGHVLPKDSVLPFVVQSGSKLQRLNYAYSRRFSDEMLNELAILLSKLCQLVPGGLVCFLPSYEYLNCAYKYLEKHDFLKTLLLHKKIFREFPNNSSAETHTVEQLMRSYAEAINAPNSGGALLLSVVGGKLSEGLNFTDDLARGVIVVGLPFANRADIVLKERINYLNKTVGLSIGEEFYENICMRAVNQCIGRAARHINDYACVYLVDERYEQEHIKMKLPTWIKLSLQHSLDFNEVLAQTERFFQMKR